MQSRVLLAAVLLVIAGAVAISGGYKKKVAQPSEGVTLYQFFQSTKPLNSVLVAIPSNQVSQTYPAFTVFLDMNGNGRFEENEAAVSQIPAPVEKGLPNAFPVKFRDATQQRTLLALPRGAEVKTKIVIGDRIIERTAKKIYLDIGAVFNPTRGFSGTVGGEGEKIPVSHDGVPDLGGRKGKPNECVPLSLANSLLWLAKKHKFENKLPPTQDALVDELAADLKWTKDGVKNENVLSGKEVFTKRHGLPLQNKKIDNTVVEGESQLWKMIVKELNAGEDVELLIDFKQSPRGSSTKGHAVTVVGADKTKKKEQTITIHDPATPKGNDTYEVDRNGQILNYPLGKVYVNFIISESFTTPSATPTPPSTPTPRSPTSIPTPTSSPTPSSTPTAPTSAPSVTPISTPTVSPTPELSPT